MDPRTTQKRPTGTARALGHLGVGEQLGLHGETGRWQEKYRAEKAWLLGLEFKAFLQVMIKIPCQMLRQARGVVFRVLNYNPHLPLFFRLAETLRC
jgi:hypothetical protein